MRPTRRGLGNSRWVPMASEELVHLVYLDEYANSSNDLVKCRASAAAAGTASFDIDAVDRQMDQVVYELYGLSEVESRIVEEATR